ncbi:MAG: hypothetical protein JWO85_3445 [Candidatus Eremiobacteraeota bacterium]|jgi:hypothetical protein|nr:hypothetical protein [Candidatus Eremiobacteraeota bacterium]
MNKGVFIAAAFTAALFMRSPAAQAEPIEATIAVTVNALNGQHEVARNQADRFTFAPLPLGEVTLRRGSESLRVEGLPPLAFNYGNGPNTSVGTRTTRLSVLNGTVRHAFTGGWFAGIGETIYTQRTDYGNLPSNYYEYHDGNYYFLNGSEMESSRVAGLRLEAGRDVALGRDRFEFGAAVNPSMHGRDARSIPHPNFGNAAVAFSDPETATQVDGYARIAHSVSRRGEVLLGLRYINFTSRYSDIPGALADRNVGWAPVLGYRLRL